MTGMEDTAMAEAAEAEVEALGRLEEFGFYKNAVDSARPFSLILGSPTSGPDAYFLLDFCGFFDGLLAVASPGPLVV